jgi:hypothetical protein
VSDIVLHAESLANRCTIRHHADDRYGYRRLSEELAHAAAPFRALASRRRG